MDDVSDASENHDRYLLALEAALLDGRTITVPLAWCPRLLHATPEQQARWEICGGGYGIHWPEIDEDLSTEGLLRGAPAPWRSVPEALETVKSRSQVREHAQREVP